MLTLKFILNTLIFSLTAFLLSRSSITINSTEFQHSEIYLKSPVVFATETKFTYEIIKQNQAIPYSTQIEYDHNKDTCSEEEIKQTGTAGKHTKEIKITYYSGKEYNREIIDNRTTPAKDEIKIRGTKKNYKSMQTDSGTINYHCNLGKFTATAYDPTCLGCNATTAIGLKAGFGVVAVDKNVIPLGSQLYITGYGKAIAGDTGGYIKGKRIDLGFDSIGSWWGKREVEVYLL